MPVCVLLVPVSLWMAVSVPASGDAGRGDVLPRTPTMGLRRVNVPGVLPWGSPHVGRAGQAWHRSCRRGT